MVILSNLGVLMCTTGKTGLGIGNAAPVGRQRAWHWHGGFEQDDC